MTVSLIPHQDYKVLHRDRSDASANSYYTRSALENLLRIQLPPLTAMQSMFLNNPLPPNIGVPKPMLLLSLPEFVEYLPLLEHTKAAKRFEQLIHWKVLAMMELSSSKNCTSSAGSSGVLYDASKL